MNLFELKSFVDRAIENAIGLEENPADIIVSIQINDEKTDDFWSDDIELIYDNDCQASGCVLHGWTKIKEDNICPGYFFRPSFQNKK